MNLQAKLTLWYMMLAVVIVSAISLVDLANNMQQQFESTLDRAETLKLAATKFVRKTINSQLTKPLPVALQDPGLASDLLDLLQGGAILEISVVDPATNEVLAGSLSTRVGERVAPYPDFRDLVTHAGWREKLKVLRGNDRQLYQLETPLGTNPKVTLLFVRVIILPALIRRDIQPTMTKNAEVAILSVIGAISITFLFS